MLSFYKDDEYFSKVYIVFEDNVSLWWLRFLKSGFRHCYLLLELQNGRGYLELNPFSNQLFVAIRRKIPNFDYISYLRENNLCQVILADIAPAPLKCAPIGLFTCVELVKRVIGLHSVSTITPYQLYKKVKIVGKTS